MAKDIYAEVTTKILAELERGAIPWVKPWSATPGQNVAQNAISGRPYSGVNTVLLWLSMDQGWRTPRFLTYRQAVQVGGNVKAGSKGSMVVFVKRLAIIDKDKPEASPKLVPMMRHYTVFNLDQCENLPDKLIEGKPVRIRNPDSRDQWADDFMTATAADFREGHGEACFIPSKDFISLPAFTAFKGADHFYSTAFHELGHWAGHTSRLSRELKNRHGSKDYAREELVAELTSAFLCAEFAFDGDLRHAGYIQNWIQLLRDDKKAFVSAASKAQAAADYLRAKALQDSPVTEETAEELAA